MNRRNFFRGVSPLLGLLTIAAPSQLLALDGGGHFGFVGPNSAACLFGKWDQANITHVGEWGTAKMWIGNPGVGQVGGISWRFNNKDTVGVPAVPISGSMLEDKCGYIDATVLSQRGADTASFSAQDYLGLTWKAKEQSDGSVFQYEYAVSGVSSSTLISTRTVLIAETVKPVITEPAMQNLSIQHANETISFDVTSLGSAVDNVDGAVAITYRVGSTVLTGPYVFAIGSTSVTMDAVDSVGNAAIQKSFIVTVSDTAAPAAPTIASATFNPDRTLSVSGTAEPGSYVNVTFPDASTATAVASGSPANTPLSTVGAVSTSAPSGAYSVTSATPQSSGTVSVTAMDGSGNTSVASVSAIDAVAPDVVLSGAPAELPAGPSTFQITITFSEGVLGFDGTDIVAVNATVNSVSGSGAVYTASLSTPGTGEVRLSIPAAAAADAAGNSTTASNSLVISTGTVEKTQKSIANFMYARANQLIASQPNLTGFLGGTAAGALDLSVTRGRGSFDLASDSNKSVWFQLTGAWNNDGTADNRTAFGAFGGHLYLRKNLLLGGMLQMDHLTQQNGVASLSGTGWMVGPYVVAKLPNDPLFVQGSLLYGKSSNKVSPLGTYEDSFDTTRLLAQVKVTGDINYRSTVISPYLNAAYLKDDQDAYVDTPGNQIGAQSINLTQARVGLDATRFIPTNNGELELQAGFAGIWSSTGGTQVAQAVLPGYLGWRGKVDLGLGFQSDTHGVFSANAFVDGLGASDYESYGISLNYAMQF